MIINPYAYSSGGDLLLLEAGVVGIDANTVLMLHMDGTDTSTTFTDSSSSAHTVTANGNAQIDTALSKFGGASGLFDGTGDYLSANDSADWDFGTGAFGVDFWIYLAAGTFGEAKGLVGSFNTPEQTGWNCILVSGTRRVAFNKNGPTEVIRSDTDIPSSAWTHISIQRNGDNIYMWQDGVLVASASGQSSVSFDSCGEGLSVGRYYIDYDGFYIPASFDELRIKKSAPYTESSDPLYISSGTPADGFTPPTSAYAAGTTGALLLEDGGYLLLE